VVGKKGFQIPEEKAMEHIGGYFVALDMTARDLQLEAKKNGHPWALSKGWDTSTPAGDFIDKTKIPNPENLQLWLKVNGEMRQNGNTTDMIFSIKYLISFISSYMTLEEGDVILTGTPSGVGGLHGGDVIEAGIADISQIKFSVEKS
jgi:acylpyruvate hydrolase